MATDVGTLQASLSLDISVFRAGMEQAATLASQLSKELQTAMGGSVSFDAITRSVTESLEQVKALQAEISGLNAKLEGMSGSDMFVQMKTHTAQLKEELSQLSTPIQADQLTSGINNALTTATTHAQTFKTTLAAVVPEITNIQQALNGLNMNTNTSGVFSIDTASVQRDIQEIKTAISSLSNTTGAPVIDFSKAVAESEQMEQNLRTMYAYAESIGRMDTDTGEYLGAPDQQAFTQVWQTLGAINTELTTATSKLLDCAQISQDWASNLSKARSSMSSLQGASSGVNSTAGKTSDSFFDMVSGSKQANSEAEKLDKNLATVNGHAVNIQGILGGIVIAQAFYTMLNIVESMVAGSIEFAQNMEDAAVSFSYLMSDASVSSESFLNALKSIALMSPLSTTNLTDASRQLMAMGFSAEATIPTLQILTDTAAVFSNDAGSMADTIDSVSLALGQMVAAGTASAQELRQLYNAGIPVYELLEEGLGISADVAKNIGNYDIDSSTAVFAILEQLQEKYAGAAEDLSNTMSGSIEVISVAIQTILAYGWGDLFVDITNKLNEVSNFLQALVKITQAYGAGGFFQAVFPESSWTTLRQVWSGLIAVKNAFADLGIIVGSLVLDAFGMLSNALATLLPYLAVTVQVMNKLTSSLMTAYPALRYIAAGLIALLIASSVYKVLAQLAVSLYALTGAKAVVTVFLNVASAIATAASIAPMAAGLLLGLAAAFVAIVVSSEAARQAIANFFSGVANQLGNLTASLGLSDLFSDVLTPEFEFPDTDDYSIGLEDMADSLSDVEDAAEAASSAGDNLQSFDEVFTIDTSTDTDTSSTDSWLDTLDSLGSLDYSDAFDWAGDWATDWENITSSLDTSALNWGDAIASMSADASTFWETLKTSLLGDSDLAANLLGAAVGAILGGLVGHPFIGAALGVLALNIANWFWEELAEAWDLSDSSVAKANIASSIGLLLGAAIGAVFGSAYIGAALGMLGAGFVTMLWEYMYEHLNVSESSGIVLFATTLGSSILAAISRAFSNIALSSIFGGFAESLASNWDDVVKILDNVITWDSFTSLGPAIIKAFSGSWDDIIRVFSTLGDDLLVAFKSGFKFDVIGFVAGIGLDFLAAYLTNALGEAIGKSADEIGDAQTWGTWSGTVLSVLGAIIGTAIAPGVGTLIGSLLGQALGQLIGVLISFFKDDVASFFSTAMSVIAQGFSDMGETISEFFTVTIPKALEDFNTLIQEFFTVTVPAAFELGLYSIGFALGRITATVIEFCTVTVPDALKAFDAYILEFFTVTIPATFDKFTDDVVAFFKDLDEKLITFCTVTVPQTLAAFGQALITFCLVTVPQTLKDFVSAIGQAASNIIAAFNSILEGIGTFISDTISKLVTFVTKDIPAIASSMWSACREIGSNVVKGIVSGISGLVGSVTSAVSSVVSTIVSGFQDGLDIHSPSKLTTWMGEMVTQGLGDGMIDNVNSVLSSASTISDALLEAIQPEAIDTDGLVNVTDDAMDTSLTKLTTWSTNLLTILTTTFESMSDMFNNLTFSNVDDVLSNTDLSSGVNLQGVQAAESITNTNTNGTSPTEVAAMLVELADTSIEALSTTIAQRIYEYLAPILTTLSPEDQSQMIAYVGTLIADESGLKELNNKLRVIQRKETKRRGE